MLLCAFLSLALALFLAWTHTNSHSFIHSVRSFVRLFTTHSHAHTYIPCAHRLSFTPHNSVSFSLTYAECTLIERVCYFFFAVYFLIAGFDDGNVVCARDAHFICSTVCIDGERERERACIRMLIRACQRDVVVVLVCYRAESSTIICRYMRVCVAVVV